MKKINPIAKNIKQHHEQQIILFSDNKTYIRIIISHIFTNIGLNINISVEFKYQHSDYFYALIRASTNQRCPSILTKYNNIYTHTNKSYSKKHKQ